MSDFDAGGAAAPADSAPVSAPEVEAVVTPNPVSTERDPAPEPAKAEPDKPLSTREALAKAAEKVNAADKPTDKPAPVKTEPNRDAPTGKFAPKEGEAAKPVDAAKPGEAPKAAETAPQPASDAPARFSADAKAAWTAAPEPVKAEVNRAIKEMEAGIEKHRQSAEAFEPVRKYADMARQGGTTLDKALEAYVGMETMLRQDPIKGLHAVCENMGLSLRDVAAHVLGQTPDQAASQSDATVRELKAEIASLKQQVGGVVSKHEAAELRPIQEQVESFAKENPLFDYVADDITKHISEQKAAGRTPDLAEAYQAALALHPHLAALAAQTPTPAPITAPAPALSAQTRKGSLSITGAPSPGSDPANRQPSSSIKDALRKAIAQAG